MKAPKFWATSQRFHTFQPLCNREECWSIISCLQKVNTHCNTRWPFLMNGWLMNDSTRAKAVSWLLCCARAIQRCWFNTVVVHFCVFRQRGTTFSAFQLTCLTDFIFFLNKHTGTCNTGYMWVLGCENIIAWGEVSFLKVGFNHGQLARGYYFVTT